MIIMIMVRNLHRDITRYNRILTEDEKTEEREESGWKLVHGDVFRPPSPFPMMFAVFCGTGVQLLCMGFATSTTEAGVIIPLYVPPRSRPTGATVVNASSFGATTQQAGRVATSITFSQGTIQSAHLQMASSSGTSFTAGLPIFFYNAATGTPGKIILTGMEL